MIGRCFQIALIIVVGVIVGLSVGLSQNSLSDVLVKYTVSTAVYNDVTSTTGASASLMQRQRRGQGISDLHQEEQKHTQQEQQQEQELQQQNSSNVAIPNTKSQSFQCESWPLSSKSLPLGNSLTYFDDGKTSPSCGGMCSLMKSTFDLSFVTSNSRYIKFNSTNVDDCSKVEPSTLFLLNRVNDSSIVHQHIRDCLSRQRFSTLDSSPFMSFRGPPKSGKFSELAGKAGLPKVFQQYAPCDYSHLDDEGACILPRTYRITEDKEECHHFFSDVLHQQNNNENPTRWVRKPVRGFGGKGIELIRNVQEELSYYASCEHVDPNPDRKKDHPGIVVQQYLRPYLLLEDQRSFHIRTFFLYKFGSADEENDPPQAWHVRVGNVHICSEPYSMIDDEELGSYAMKCNRHAWETNPRIQHKKTKQRRLFGGDEEDVEEDVEEDGPSFFQPFPQYLQENLGQDEFTTLMKRIDDIFLPLSKVVRGLSQDTGKHNVIMPNEFSWLVLGVDLVVDEHLRPWLIEVNPCFGNPLYGTNRQYIGRNPLIVILRIMMSHYKRQLLLSNGGEKKDDLMYHEDACETDDEVGPWVTRIM